jgi:diguanylate cyclase (GGDEF)-like protein/PAS domain S-box-containing protein
MATEREPSTAEPAPAILVVDDNPGSRLAVCAMLEPLGHAVVEAVSGRDALRAVLGQTFALILLDVRMPTLDGYETAKLIRQRPQVGLTPIIFVTAFGQDETHTAAAYASGAVDFIFTPILPDVLRAKVSRFVDLFLQARELKQSLEAITALNAALRDSELRARTVLQNVADGIVTAGEDGIIESFNRAARQLFGYRDEEVIGRPLQILIAPGHHDSLSDSARAGNLRGEKRSPAEPTETMGCRKDGSSFTMEIDISQMQLGERTLTIAAIRDISGRKAYTEALEHRTLHDDLTGLPNRTLFNDRVDRAVAAAERADEQRGVLLIDLDEFQQINETLGRDRGDLALQAVGARLRDALRDVDSVARLGSDEFGILPFGNTDLETGALIAWKVLEAFERPFLISGHVVNLRASVGLALFPQHGRDAAELLSRAHLAMRQAKQSGAGLAVFVADPEDEAAGRLTLLSELRDGIPRGELVAHFQPKVDLVTRRTTGVEALVRWSHPTDGLLMPAEFMPAAERSALIEPLTTWILGAALEQQRRWLDAGLDLTMAVNISARSLTRRSDLADTLATLTERWGIASGKLILELTENAIVDTEVVDSMHALHAMGKRLAIDDFGTGYSSLVHLRRLPVDEIKVDRSFVTSLASNLSDAVIVNATIGLGHNLGLTVVAEGVEDEAALNILVAHGCDSAQGYFFSRPCPADELTAWLAESPFGVRR